MKKGQNPIFPSKFTFGDKDEYGAPIIRDKVSFGISTRLFLAGMAMQGFLANSSLIDDHYSENTSELIVKKSLHIADELLKQEEE